MANIHRMTKKRLGELLLQEEVITDGQLREALDEQEKTGELIGDILVRKGFCTESDVARTISTQFSFPYISVMNYYISPEMTTVFSLEILEKHLFVPIDRFGDVLNIVVAGLLDQSVVNEIEKKSGCACQVYVGMVSEVKQVIKEKFASSAAKSASKAAATAAAAKAPVDVTAPPPAKSVATAMREEDNGETIDLSDAIMAVENSSNGDDENTRSGNGEDDEKEESDGKLEQDFKHFRFFEEDEEDSTESKEDDESDE